MSASTSRPPRLLPCGRPRPDSHPRPRLSETSWRQKLDAHLEARGLKHSEQRLKIVRLMLSYPGHFNVQEIARHIHRDHPEIGIATIYRNISLLAEAGILKETLIDGQGQATYEAWDDEHHDHIVCVSCGQIFEFHDEEIERRQEALGRKLKFRQIRHRHVIYVECEFMGLSSGISRGASCPTRKAPDRTAGGATAPCSGKPAR